MFFEKIFYKIYVNNYISVGGPFGIGKSTLVEALAEHFGTEKIMELSEKDEFSEAILNAMYSKTETYIAGTGNEWFLWKRFEAHKKVAASNKKFVMDGSIFQTPVISNIAEKKSDTQQAFNYIVKALCEKVAYKIGIPKLYVILEGKWELVKARIIQRGRPSEVNNLAKNEEMFQKLTSKYTEKMIEECKRYKINYIVIDANLPTAEKIKIIANHMKKENIKFSTTKQTEELPLKYANTIAIGGMIGAGKSTLTHALEKANNWKGVQELIEGDPWQDAFLKEFYNTDQEYIRTMFQTYIAQYRNKKYVQSLSSKRLTVQDRTIFEDRIFADLSIKDAKSWNYYNKVWYSLADKLAYDAGLPKLYIILSLDFETFKKRVFLRGRQSEINSFDKNLEYFKKLHHGYSDKMVELCKMFHIPFIILDARLSTEEQVELITKKIKNNKIEL